ncbi:MAG: Asp-tRNA(Asn)/Glu-tRNA(Gln) amidotransferase subunit GatA [Candidatus Kerfeldbacteria bacterium]|nr:Asp-tRNA(Asn)/Glu-tRNA(Gln) amidotransferase subunit GatA [Candidatus Kerfeldbacteria bacterium]
MTIREFQEARKNGATISELVTQFQRKIEEKNPQLNAFLTTTFEQAQTRAQTLDQQSIDHVLCGVPLAIKDVILTKGVRTTASSKMLDHHTASYDAHVIEELNAHGAIMMGKTNCDEFAMGASNENSAFGLVRNPFDLKRVPGGSSGGSAAAVAADLCVAALGTDTGGSIRQPAAFCGVVGLKPTYGRVSRYGLIALCSSFDTIGPITKTVEDAAILLDTIAGYDSHDMTSVPNEVPSYASHLQRDLRGLKIGIPSEYFVDGMNLEVEQRIRDAVKQLERLGVEPVEVSLPHTKYAIPVYYVILSAEASSNLARFDGIRYGTRSTDSPESAMDRLLDTYLSSRSHFGPEPKRRMMLGSFVLSSGYADRYYHQAQKVRAMIKEEFDAVFQNVDVLVAPTTPATAFKLGEQVNDPLKMYLEDIFTCPVNIAGLPAISIPCGTASKLPVGLQIIGKPLDELTILQVAYQFEQSQKVAKA